MYALTHGRTTVLHLPRPARRSSGLWGLSQRFWACFVLGSALVMFDAFETLGFLAAGSHMIQILEQDRPDAILRLFGENSPDLFLQLESNPFVRAVVGVSPVLMLVSHAIVIGLFLAMFWLLTRERVERLLCRRPLHPLLVRLGAPRGDAMLRLMLWIVPLMMVLEFGAIDGGCGLPCWSGCSFLTLRDMRSIVMS